MSLHVTSYGELIGEMLTAGRSAERPRRSPVPGIGSECGLGAIENHLLRHVDLLATAYRARTKSIWFNQNKKTSRLSDRVAQRVFLSIAEAESTRRCGFERWKPAGAPSNWMARGAKRSPERSARSTSIRACDSCWHSRTLRPFVPMIEPIASCANDHRPTELTHDYRMCTYDEPRLLLVQ